MSHVCLQSEDFLLNTIMHYYTTTPPLPLEEYRFQKPHTCLLFFDGIIIISFECQKGKKNSSKILKDCI